MSRLGPWGLQGKQLARYLAVEPCLSADDAGRHVSSGVDVNQEFGLICRSVVDPNDFSRLCIHRRGGAVVRNIDGTVGTACETVGVLQGAHP
jgi:hypothetical protein